MLESRSHAAATFVTLTYRDEELNAAPGVEWNGQAPLVPSLVPSDLQKWLKRFRKKLADHDLGPVRFFAVGEYGSEKGRPHFHLALFGYPSCVNGETQKRLQRCCGPCQIVKETWRLGSVQLNKLNRELAQYLCKYIVDEKTKEGLWQRDQIKILGLHPEFRRMSNGGKNQSGGIGAAAIKNLISGTVESRKGRYLQTATDAPAVLTLNGRTLSLGRYLRRKWREYLGRAGDTPEHEIKRLLTQLQLEKVAADEAQRSDALTHLPSVTGRDAYFYKYGEKIRSLEKKQKIFSKKGSL